MVAVQAVIQVNNVDFLFFQVYRIEKRGSQEREKQIQGFLQGNEQCGHLLQRWAKVFRKQTEIQGLIFPEDMGLNPQTAKFGGHNVIIVENHDRVIHLTVKIRQEGIKAGVGSSYGPFHASFNI